MSEEESKLILYTTEDGKTHVSLMSRDGRVWLNQKQMAELFAVSKPNISIHISKILEEKELDDSVVKCYLTTAADGKQYKVIYYALEMILAVGFRVRGGRGTQFRQWANAHLSEYLVKGFTMDDARLKNPDGRPDYFDELLARIRDIRASEKRFYQKVRDLLALSSDYRGNELRTNLFFAEVQNKLLYAATEHTAAELIVARAEHKGDRLLIFPFRSLFRGASTGLRPGALRLAAHGTGVFSHTLSKASLRNDARNGQGEAVR